MAGMGGFLTGKPAAVAETEDGHGGRPRACARPAGRASVSVRCPFPCLSLWLSEPRLGFKQRRRERALTTWPLGGCGRHSPFQLLPPTAPTGKA